MPVYSDRCNKLLLGGFEVLSGMEAGAVQEKSFFLFIYDMELKSGQRYTSAAVWGNIDIGAVRSSSEEKYCIIHGRGQRNKNA
jgi:hypothetical protein